VGRAVANDPLRRVWASLVAWRHRL
jgi:hypothetical protein